jgi:recombination protein RecT
MAEAAATGEKGTSLTVDNSMTLRDLLQRSQGTIQATLPAHMKVDRLIKLALLAAVREPKLFECTKESMIQAIMTAAQLGLEPNGMLGSAYLVPFKNTKQNRMEVQLIPGYRGLVDLAKRSGEVDGVEARPVFTGEKFEVFYGTDPKIIHIPNFEMKRLYENIRAFYVVATFDGGHKQFEVMSKEEVDAIRARSKSSDVGPWKTDYIEMGKKTVTKRASKYWPLSPEKAEAFARAVEHDNRLESGEIGGIDIERDTPESISASVATKTAESMDGLKERMKPKAVAATSDLPAEEIERQRQMDEEDAQKPKA